VGQHGAGKPDRAGGQDRPPYSLLLGLQADYDLMQRRREIKADLSKIDGSRSPVDLMMFARMSAVPRFGWNIRS
jgi:hypothetical protein